MKKQSVKKWIKGWFNSRNQKSSSTSPPPQQPTQSEQCSQSWTQAEAQIVNHLINMDSIIKISKQISEEQYATLYTINQILCKEVIDLNLARKALIGGIHANGEIRDKDGKQREKDKEKEKDVRYVTKQLPFQYYSVRSLLWKVCVGYLTPGGKEKWVSFMEKNLACYMRYIIQYIVQPIEKKLGVSTQSLSPDLKKQISNQEKLKGQKLNEKKQSMNEQKVKDHPLNFSQQSKWGNYFKDVQLWKTIQKDTKRTRKSCKFFQQPHQLPLPPDQTPLKPSHLTFSTPQHQQPPPQTYSDSLTRILFIYLKTHPTESYCQGMNQIVALIYYCFTNKNSQYFRRVSQSDTYFVFQSVMSRLPRKHFQRGEEYVKEFLGVMKKLDLRLFEELEKSKSGDLMKMVTMKWFLSGFLTQYNIDQSLIIWDAFITWPSQPQQQTYLTQCFTYMALSIIHLQRQKIIEGQNILTIFNKINEQCTCQLVVQKTWNLYKLFPKLLEK